jgi:hypothetical protein
MRHSSLGIVSFVLSLISGLAMAVVVAVAGVMEASTPGGIEESSVSAVIIGLFVIFLLCGTLLALGFGIAGCLKKDRKRIFAVLGVVFASVTVVLTIALIIIGNTI